MEEIDKIKELNEIVDNMIILINRLEKFEKEDCDIILLKLKYVKVNIEFYNYLIKKIKTAIINEKFKSIVKPLNHDNKE